MGSVKKKLTEFRAGLPGCRRRGRRCADERLRIEALLWVLRGGAGWRFLPERFGSWKTVYSCFRAWTAIGLWAAVLEALSQDADHEFLMLDSTAVRVHAHGCGARGGQLAQGVARSRASLSTKIHMAADALGYPLGFILTGANVSDFDQAPPLIRKHLKPNAYAIMDKGYDSDAIRNCVQEKGGIAAIAVKANRASKPPFDQHIYAHRHRIENLFARLKNYRRIATRYEKLLRHFNAMLTIAAIIIWLKF